MKNLGILAIAAVTALVLGVASFGTKSAQAEALGSSAMYCGWFVPYFGNACDGTDLTEAELVTIATDDDFGDGDGNFELTDLADLDLEDNQITDGGGFPLGSILVFAFVDDDEIVTFDAPTGVTVDVNHDGVAAGAADADTETCDAADDLDCDNAVNDDGDGIVVATITDGSADAGDELDVDITQADNTNVSRTETINVVGLPDDIVVSVVANKATVQTDAGDCEDEADVTDGGQIADVDKTFVQGVVTDNDGTELTRISVDWSVDDEDISFIADDTSVTVDAGDIGTAAFAVVCGGDTTGVNTITGEELIDDETSSVEVTTVGAPASIALTASPALINCDGLTSSTVTATVTDSEGNNVAGGTNVNFSVVALGTANPINFATVNGQASSQITPLAGGVAGVTVIVSSGSAQSSIRVDCNPAAPTTPGAQPTPTGGTGVVPPDTGNGGYLGQDSSSGFPMWTLVALALGAVAMVGGGMIARRVAK